MTNEPICHRHNCLLDENHECVLCVEEDKPKTYIFDRSIWVIEESHDEGKTWIAECMVYRDRKSAEEDARIFSMKLHGQYRAVQYLRVAQGK